VSYLLDTNILSELRKPVARRNVGVMAWFSMAEADELYLSVLVIGEIHKGIERVRGSDQEQARALSTWLRRIETNYADRILQVTIGIATRWGQLQAIRNYPVIDALLAATADEHGLRLVSRNVQQLVDWPAVHPHLNPFESA
jgi:toxin FitB